MKTFSARDAKNRFGEVMDAAQAGPVMIEKHGRPSAVVLSNVEYEALEVARLRMALQPGLEDVREGRVYDMDDVFEDLKQDLEKFAANED